MNGIMKPEDAPQHSVDQETVSTLVNQMKFTLTASMNAELTKMVKQHVDTATTTLAQALTPHSVLDERHKFSDYDLKIEYANANSCGSLEKPHGDGWLGPTIICSPSPHDAARGAGAHFLICWKRTGEHRISNVQMYTGQVNQVYHLPIIPPPVIPLTPEYEELFHQTARRTDPRYLFAIFEAYNPRADTIADLRRVRAELEAKEEEMDKREKELAEREATVEALEASASARLKAAQTVEAGCAEYATHHERMLEHIALTEELVAACTEVQTKLACIPEVSPEIIASLYVVIGKAAHVLRR